MVREERIGLLLKNPHHLGGDFYYHFTGYSASVGASLSPTIISREISLA